MPGMQHQWPMVPWWLMVNIALEIEVKPGVANGANLGPHFLFKVCVFNLLNQVKLESMNDSIHNTAGASMF